MESTGIDRLAQQKNLIQPVSKILGMKINIQSNQKERQKEKLNKSCKSESDPDFDSLLQIEIEKLKEIKNV